jgi:hypothetical protein
MWGEAFLYKVEQFPHRLVQWSTIALWTDLIVVEAECGECLRETKRMID